ncbi:hypothetical protein [Schlesneria sp. DSM 10557]|uniref:hypothetical protein n=1 Tax=Schlesneria sp. DSM 10557 TaxID=3044399 RepID=UPI0035A119FD
MSPYLRWTLYSVVAVAVAFPETAWSQRSSRGGGERTRSSRDDSTSLINSLRNKELVEKLGLTPEQQSQIDEIRQAATRSYRGMSTAEFQAAKKANEDKVLNLLTDEQKATWQKHVEQATGTPPAGIPGGAPGSGGSENSSAPSGGSTSVESDLPNAKAAVPDNGPPPGAKTVISFGPEADLKAAQHEAAEKEAAREALEEQADFAEEAESDPGKPGDSRRTSPETTPPREMGDEEALLSFEFRYAPWESVLKLFADANDLTLDLNDVPPGTFSYYDNKRHTMTEALDILNGYLLQKGYILIRRDRFLVCLSTDSPIPPNVIPNVTTDELFSRGKNELLNLILPLEGTADADLVVLEVKELLGPYGKAVALKSTNSLVLTDTGGNLQRIQMLLKTGTPVGNKDTAFKSIALKHISAAEAERTVRRLFGLNPPVTSSAPAAAPARGGFGGGRERGGGGFPGGGFPGGGFPGAAAFRGRIPGGPPGGTSSCGTCRRVGLAVPGKNSGHGGSSHESPAGGDQFDFVESGGRRYQGAGHKRGCGGERTRKV